MIKKRKRVEEAERDAALRLWSSSNPTQAAVPDADESVPQLSRGARLPVGLADLPLTILEWPFPAREVASKMLDGLTRKDSDDMAGGALADLRAAWESRCDGFQGAYCRPCTTRPTKDKVCYIANRCLCQTPEQRNLCRFVLSLTTQLCGRGGVLSKGSATRAAYDVGRLCLRVYRKGREEEVREKDWFIHISYGNLNTSLFYVFRLITFSGTILGNVRELTLHADTVAGPRHLWGHVRRH